MATPRNHVGIPFLHSIRPRILALVIGLVVAVSMVFFYYILHQFEQVAVFQLEHQGLLMSDLIEAGIHPFVADRDIPEIQKYIDRFVRVREKNDIEINIMFLDGHTSHIVAGNNPDNVGETSGEEHAALLDALKNDTSIIRIDQDNDQDKDDHADDRSHPDYYIPDAYRFLSITTPLVIDAKRVGSINVKMSLQFLDEKIRGVLFGIVAAILFEVGIIIFGMTLILNRQLLSPLWHMIRYIVDFGGKGLDHRLPVSNQKDELGILGGEFNNMLDRIQQLVREMHDMVDNIAHDLKSPITRLRIGAELALTLPFDQRNDGELIENTIEECDNMLIIINTMLLMAETEAGTIQPQKSQVNVSDIAQKACALFQAVAEERDILLTWDIVPRAMIMGNSGMIQRLISNLLENALKYSLPKGRVHVSVRVSASEGQVILAVRDHGMGIPEKDLSKIFEKFYRCDHSRSQPGIGLGLSLCRAILTIHHGHITVTSKPDKGSTFTVMLPHIP